MKLINKTIGLFLLVTLLLLKMTALHTFTHHEGSEEDTDCIVCNIAAEQEQQLATVSTPTLELVVEPVFISKEIPKIKPSHITAYILEFNYCRPPPVLI